MKAFLRRSGGVDQYPAVKVEWILHHPPQLFARTRTGRNVTVDLAPLKTAALHKLFSKHFEGADVEPAPLPVRTWRRFFGWAYGISTLEAAILFTFATLLLGLACYTLCFRYTALCDSIQDL